MARASQVSNTLGVAQLQLQLLHPFFTCLFQPVYLPSYTIGVAVWQSRSIVGCLACHIATPIREGQEIGVYVGCCEMAEEHAMKGTDVAATNPFSCCWVWIM